MLLKQTEGKTTDPIRVLVSKLDEEEHLRKILERRLETIHPNPGPNTFDDWVNNKLMTFYKKKRKEGRKEKRRRKWKKLENRKEEKRTKNLTTEARKRGTTRWHKVMQQKKGNKSETRIANIKNCKIQVDGRGRT